MPFLLHNTLLYLLSSLLFIFPFVAFPSSFVQALSKWLLCLSFTAYSSSLLSQHMFKLLL